MVPEKNDPRKNTYFLLDAWYCHNNTQQWDYHGNGNWKKKPVLVVGNKIDWIETALEVIFGRIKQSYCLLYPSLFHIFLFAFKRVELHLIDNEINLLHCSSLCKVSLLVAKQQNIVVFFIHSAVNIISLYFLSEIGQTM